MAYRDETAKKTFCARFSESDSLISRGADELTTAFIDRLLEAGIAWDAIKVTENGGGSSVHAYTVFYRHHQEIK